MFADETNGTSLAGTLLARGGLMECSALLVRPEGLAGVPRSQASDADRGPVGRWRWGAPCAPPFQLRVAEILLWASLGIFWAMRAELGGNSDGEEPVGRRALNGHCTAGGELGRDRPCAAWDGEGSSFLGQSRGRRVLRSSLPVLDRCLPAPSRIPSSTDRATARRMLGGSPS